MRWTKEEEEILKNAIYNSKENLKKLFPSRGYNSIKGKINDLGFKRRKEIGLDRSFFSKVDTEEKAYLLGVLEAEGSIGKNKVDLVIGEKDLDWLIILRNLSGSKATISLNMSPLGKAYRVSFCSKQWVEDLRKLGFRSGKLPEIDNSLLTYYIRGLFDGDGSICRDKYNECLISLFYGQKILMDSCHKWLLANKINCNNTHKNPTCHYIKMHRLATQDLADILPAKEYMLKRKSILLHKSKMINHLPKKVRSVELDEMVQKLYNN